MTRLLWREFSLYSICHICAGVLTILSSYVCWALPPSLLIGFVIYEISEDYHINDGAFKDVLEYCIGLYGSTILLLVMAYG